MSDFAINRAPEQLPELKPGELFISYYDALGEQTCAGNMNRAIRLPLILLSIALGAIAALLCFESPKVSKIIDALSSQPSVISPVFLYFILVVMIPSVSAWKRFTAPTHIHIAPDGLQFLWLGSSPSAWLMWKTLRSVTVEKRRPPRWVYQSMQERKSSKSGFLAAAKNLIISFTPAAERQTALAISYSIDQQRTSKFALLSWVSSILNQTPGCARQYFFVDALLPGDQQKLIAALKQYAPDVLGQDVLDIETNEEAPRYTTLWIKELERSGSQTKNLDAGTVLAGPKRKYEIVNRLGSGGQAVIYRARISSQSADNNNDIVLKEFILPVGGGVEITEQSINHIRKEYDLIRSLDHPQIVRSIDFFVSGRRAYLAMNTINGRTLRARVEKEGPFDEDQVLDLALQMCDILIYLHDRQPPVVHRDFTPDNLMLTESGQLVLIDFNVAKRLEADSSTLTAVGRHCYIPVEQFQGRASTKSDIYAMGCTLYFLITGGEPEPITPSNLQAAKPAASDFMHTLIGKATAKNENDRYASGTEIAKAIREYRSIKLSQNERVPEPATKQTLS